MSLREARVDVDIFEDRRDHAMARNACVSGSLLVGHVAGRLARLAGVSVSTAKKCGACKSPQDRLLSAAGFQDSCDDGLMRLICPTCQIGGAGGGYVPCSASSSFVYFARY